MDHDAQRAQSQLFTVRLWLDGGAPEPELRGHVQHVPSGRGRHFRSWPALIAFFEQHLEPPDVGQQPNKDPRAPGA